MIIAVFAMMLFAMLAWTLLSMQSAVFETNLRSFDSENALGLAESGVNYGLSQLMLNSSWRTSADTDCADAGDWLVHNLSPGQYAICSRNPTASETGSVILESRGYVPLRSSYRAMRDLIMSVQMGSFTKVLQAKNLLEWSNMHGNSGINGDTQALYYNGDGDGTYNESGVDYKSGSSCLPPDSNNRPRQREVADEPYPTIDMAYYESQAGARTWEPDMTAKITAISTAGGKTELTVDSDIFLNSQWEGQGLRNITQGHWQAGSWQSIETVTPNRTVKLSGVVNWSVNDRVTVVPVIASVPVRNVGQRTYEVIFNCNLDWNVDNAVRNLSLGTWNETDWGVITSIWHPTTTSTRVRIRMDESAAISMDEWQDGHYLAEVKRYRTEVRRQDLWYIKSDVLIDVRNDQSWESGNPGDVEFNRTSLVAEGDTGIKGPNEIWFSERPFIYPNLATKNGNITSLDTPGGGSENTKRGRRNFDDLIYTETGRVDFNYLDGKALFGQDIYLDGQVRINFDSDISRLTGFTWGLSQSTWKEQ